MLYDEGTDPCTYSISQGIKRQQQHFEMMAMAEELARLLVMQSWPHILPEAMAFVKVGQGYHSSH